MLSGTCHCGAITIEVPKPPQALIDCNCSICRRYGALWALYQVGTVRVIGHPENTSEYIWGPKTIKTLRCRHCGCVTHWEPMRQEPGSKLGINIRNFDPSVIASARIRRFDGADQWAYLDE
jgi:hypothetical protein